MSYHRETDGESNDEEEENDEDFREGGQDVGEHDDINAEERKLSQEEYEVHPGKEDHYCSGLPLPWLQRIGTSLLFENTRYTCVVK